MATHDYVISNASGASVRADLNNALAAIVSNNSSATSPSTTYAYQFWADTTTGQLKIRNAANSAWITLMELDGTMLMEDGTVSAPGLAFASDTNTGFFRSAADTLNFATGGAERLEIGSSEVVFNDPSNDVDFRVESNGNANMLFVDAGNDRLGIGTSSPDAFVHLKDNSPFIRFTDAVDDTHYAHIGYTDAGVLVVNADPGNAKASSAIQFQVDNSEAARIDSSGRLLIGATSSTSIDASLQVIKDGTAAQFHRGSADTNGPSIMLTKSRNTTYGSNTILQDGDTLGLITFRGDDGTDYATRGVQLSAEVDGTPGSNVMPGAFVIKTTPSGSGTPSERMRINASGNVYIGTTGSSTAKGISLNNNGFSRFNRDSNTVMAVQRGVNDGTLIAFAQAGSTEGSISVSGSSVSYNGGHLARWSQLAGGADRTEILRGSVLSNLDEMCEWAYDAQDAVLYTEEDELPEGVSVGDVKTPAVAAGTEDNEQLNRMKVSDVEGDPNVAGVFQCWDDDDDIYTNDFYCAMTGDFVIRIAQGTTVARGDLLMSAGDGTAKPQDDDIVRSKTIAKVTSTTVSVTYADGSYCVPCVLMAC